MCGSSHTGQDYTFDMRRKKIGEVCKGLGYVVATRPTAAIGASIFISLSLALGGYFANFKVVDSAMYQWAPCGGSISRNRDRYSDAFGSVRVAIVQLNHPEMATRLPHLYDLEARVRNMTTGSGKTLSDVCAVAFTSKFDFFFCGVAHWTRVTIYLLRISVILLLQMGRVRSLVHSITMPCRLALLFPALRAAVDADPTPELTISRANSRDLYGNLITRRLVLGWDGPGEAPLNTTRVASATQTIFVLSEDDTLKDDVSDWEEEFQTMIGVHNVGADIVSYRYTDEAQEAQMTAIAFPDPMAFGLALLLSYLFVCATIGGQKGLQRLSRVVVATTAWLCVLLAAGSGIGTSFLLGLPFGHLGGTIAFFVLAIGVDDAFVILAAFNQIVAEGSNSPCSRSIPRGIGETMFRAGPSVLLTTFTDVIAVATGLSSPYPAVRNWSVGTMLALIFVCALMMTLLPAVLAVVYEHNQKVQRSDVDRNLAMSGQNTAENHLIVLQHRTEASREFEQSVSMKDQSETEQFRTQSYFTAMDAGSFGENVDLTTTPRPSVLDRLLYLLLSRPGILLVGCITIALLILGIVGAHDIKSTSNFGNFLPDDSTQQKFIDEGAITHFGGILPICDVVFDHVDFQDTDTTTRALLLAASMMSQPSVLTLTGSHTNFWLEDFEIWRNGPNASGCETGNSGMSAAEHGFCVARFVRQDVGLQYYDDIRFGPDGEVAVSRVRFWPPPMYNSWSLAGLQDGQEAEIAKIMTEEEKAGFVYTYNYWFVAGELRRTAGQALTDGVVRAGVAIGVVFLVVLPIHLAIAVNAVLAMVLVEGVGIVALYKLSFTGATVATYILCVGFASDSAAHMAWALVDETQQSTTQSSRKGAVIPGPFQICYRAIRNYGPAMLCGGLSTIMVAAMMALTPAFTFRVLALVTASVVALAVYHGVIVLPIVVACLQLVTTRTKKIPHDDGPVCPDKAALAVAAQANAMIAMTRAGFEKSLLKIPDSWTPNSTLPEKGFSDNDIMTRVKVLSDFQDADTRLAAGKVSGTIYVGGQNLEKYTTLLTSVYSTFAWSNPLHPSVFPGVRQMESEVISMCCSLFQGGPDCCGVMTSGGSESIIMALKAYRNWAAATKGIKNPNLVLPRTAHPAFEKGCHYLGIECRKIDEIENTRTANVQATIAAIDLNTIALVGSAPHFPHGAVDPISELAKVALVHNIGLHVDCCLGSFLVPFMKQCGYDFPNFDFSVPGVTTISCDTHKYGFAPKGSSVIMYVNSDLRKHQYSVFPDWPGGIYGTPGMAGSRPGALVAATWAALVYHGAAGYRENTRAIVDTTRYIAAGIKKIPGLKLVCEPGVSVVAWTSDVFDIYRLVEELVHVRGWDLNVLQFPPAIHIAVTMAHVSADFKIADSFLADLASCTAPLVASPEGTVEGAGSMYGMAQSVPDRSIVGELVGVFLDTILTLGHHVSTAETH